MCDFNINKTSSCISIYIYIHIWEKFYNSHNILISYWRYLQMLAIEISTLNIFFNFTCHYSILSVLFLLFKHINLKIHELFSDIKSKKVWKIDASHIEFDENLLFITQCHILQNIRKNGMIIFPLEIHRSKLNCLIFHMVSILCSPTK